MHDVASLPSSLGGHTSLRGCREQMSLDLGVDGALKGGCCHGHFSQEKGQESGLSSCCY